jgi:hydroxyacylglutathione hydrolase
MMFMLYEKHELLRDIYARAYSPGAICLYDQTRRALFSGDTVFQNGLFGRCDLHGGDTTALIQSLHHLSTLDTNILLPGLEYPVFSHAKQHVELSFKNA